MPVLEQVSVINDLKGTKECRNRKKAVKLQCSDKASPSSSSRDIHINISLSSAGTKAPPRWRMKDDVDPSDFNQLRLGLVNFYPNTTLKSPAHAPS